MPKIINHAKDFAGTLLAVQAMMALLDRKVLNGIEIIECSKKSKPYTISYFLQLTEKLNGLRAITYDKNLEKSDD
jgi:hypothetical protein